MKLQLLFLFCFTILFGQIGRSQILRLNKQELNFPALNEKQTDSLSFKLTNPTDYPAEVRLIQPFQVYGSQPFQIKDSILTIPPNQETTIWVYCRILHNTPNPSNIIIKTKWNMVDAGDQFVKLSCTGKYSKVYYNSTQNLSEEVLKQALKTKLGQNVTSLSYDGARLKMYGAIDNLNDSVTCVYTNRKAKFNTTGSGSNGSNTANFNCEHTFPQGFFGSGLPMRSDIHHLYSTDEDANNSRGNLPFGVATAPFVLPSINAPSKNGGGKYEPQESHKGNAARAMMYFVLRYQDYQNFYAPQDNVLRTWHKAFPPLPKDTARNAAVFEEQNNRNPFIDYPQFEARVKNLIGFSQSDSIQKLGISDSAIGTVYGFNWSLDIGDTSSLVIWNQGNKKIRIYQLHFVDQMNTSFSLIGGDNQTFTLGYNEARKIDYRMLEWGADSLSFVTDDPANPVVKIPAVNTIVSTKEIISKARPVIYPNPSSSEMYIDLKNGISSETKVTVSNLQGKSIKSSTVTSIQGKINLWVADLPSGIYQLELMQNDRTDHLRFVKQ